MHSFTTSSDRPCGACPSPIAAGSLYRIVDGEPRHPACVDRDVIGDAARRATTRETIGLLPRVEG